MSTGKQDHICIVAGGTGGHVFPALALAKELEARGISYTFITDQRGKAFLLNPKDKGDQGQNRILLKGQPVILPLGHKKSSLLGMLVFLYQLIISFFVSIIPVWRSTKVIGFSGFPTFAPLTAAILMGKTTYIHEQNAVLGKVNRLLGRFVKYIYTSTETVKFSKAYQDKLRYTGMPVRPEIEALSAETLTSSDSIKSYSRPDSQAKSNDPIRVLIIGGSQGASQFSDVIPEAITQLPESLQERLHIVQQVRVNEISQTEKKYHGTKCADIELKPFVHDMASEYHKAHFIIARSGASTIAEVQCVGRPAIFVPYAYATDDHQTKNAEALVSKGGALLIPQVYFTPERLAAVIKDYCENPKKLLFASQRVKKSYLKSSIKVLVDSLISV